jgi:serine/threonine protein kinase
MHKRAPFRLRKYLPKAQIYTVPVVYKAKETGCSASSRLKFLPDKVANEAQALARFQPEAQAASALNHPNVCAISRRWGARWPGIYCMELLEDATLKHGISGRSLEIETLLATTDIGSENAT